MKLCSWNAKSTHRVCIQVPHRRAPSIWRRPHRLIVPALWRNRDCVAALTALAIPIVPNCFSSNSELEQAESQIRKQIRIWIQTLIFLKFSKKIPHCQVVLYHVTGRFKFKSWSQILNFGANSRTMKFYPSFLDLSWDLPITLSEFLVGIFRVYYNFRSADF